MGREICARIRVRFVARRLAFLKEKLVQPHPYLRHLLGVQHVGRKRTPC